MPAHVGSRHGSAARTSEGDGPRAAGPADRARLRRRGEPRGAAVRQRPRQPASPPWPTPASPWRWPCGDVGRSASLVVGLAFLLRRPAARPRDQRQPLQPLLRDPLLLFSSGSTSPTGGAWSPGSSITFVAQATSTSDRLVSEHRRRPDHRRADHLARADPARPRAAQPQQPQRDAAREGRAAAAGAHGAGRAGGGRGAHADRRRAARRRRPRDERDGRPGGRRAAARRARTRSAPATRSPPSRRRAARRSPTSGACSACCAARTRRSRSPRSPACATSRRWCAARGGRAAGHPEHGGRGAPAPARRRPDRLPARAERARRRARAGRRRPRARSP